ncbi:hypothetical protein D3C87_1576800 [compost metagenome]
MNGQIEFPHARERRFRIGHGDSKIATKTHQRFRPALNDGLDCLHGIMALFTRRAETEGFLHASKKSLIGNFSDADGSVTLNVGMAAQGTDTGAWPAYIAAQHQEIGELLHIGRAVGMLCDAHAITENDVFRLEVDIHGAIERFQ